MKKRAFLFIPVVSGCLLLIALACVLVCAPSSLCFFVDRWASDPDWSPDGEKIAYTCHYPSLSQIWRRGKGRDLFYWGAIGEGMEICTIYPDGSHPVRLTHNQVGDGQPAWAPDGRSIAYFSSSGIQIMGEDGSRLMEFTDTENLELGWFGRSRLVWSPDGEALCFSAKDPLSPEQSTNLYVAILESGEVYTLTALPGDERECRWSPDGTQITFVWFPLGYMSLASKEAAIQVTDLEGNRETVVTGFAGIGNLNWSLDGDLIAFWAYRSTDCVYECTEVYMVNLSDRSMKCLTERYEINPLFNVVWSPDGSRIAFTALPGPNLYTLVPNGENLVRVAPMDAPDLVWSPDGKWIAFERGTTEGEKNRIWLIQMEQGDLRELETP